MADVSHWKDLTDGTVAGRKWILASEVLAVFTEPVREFHEKGWPKPFVIAGSTGTGDLPDPEHAEIAVLDLDPGPTDTPMLTGIRAMDDALRNLPPDVLDRIRAWDPDGEAVVLTSFLDTEFELDGRPTRGARPAAWVRLEDKLTVDGLWDAAGIAREPSVVVPAERSSLAAAHREFDRGLGTAWACDTTEGWHGGGEYTRWVRTDADLAEAAAFMAEHGTRVRVMPFLEGVPCSIHGMVFPDAVVAFRPVELITFRHTASTRLRYGGTATTWDPPPADRDAMRAAARRMGAFLRTEHGFRGAFTIDGVMTAAGFRPTELNPRFGGGLFAIVRGSDLPLLGIHRALIAGDDLDYRPEELEAVAIEAADANRILRGMLPVERTMDETMKIPITLADGTVERADDEEHAHGTLSLGPASFGGIVQMQVDAEHTPTGVQAAPIVLDALRLAAETWDLAIPDLEVAKDVR